MRVSRDRTITIIIFYIIIMRISILFLETFHMYTLSIYLCTTFIIYILYQSISFYVKCFELSKDTALYKNKFIIIYTTIGEACVCVCVQNLTNFCPYALISTPNVP